MKRLTMMCLLFCVVIGAHAQQTIEILGTVTDSLGSVIKQTALVMVVDKTTLTKVAGGEYTETFRIDYVAEPEKAYLLYAFVSGYKDRYMEITGKSGNMGSISLSELSQKLKEVVVQSQSIQRSFEEGKDVFKVAGTELSKEVSLTSLLNRFPGIYTDDGNVYILGAGKPIYTINGLPPRTGEMQFLTPDRIEKITIDRMPSALYASSVNGVIDIQLKKTVRDYLSARMSNSTSWSEKGNLFETPSLYTNLQLGKWFVYAGYSFSYGDGYSSGEQFFDTYLPDRTISEQSKNHSNYIRRSHNLSTLLKYQLDDKQSIDLQYSFSSDENVINEQTNTSRMDTESADETILNTTISNPLSKNHSFSGRYEYKNKSRSFAFDAAYGYGTSDRDNDIDEKINAVDYITRQKENSSNYAYTFRAYYFDKLGKNWTLQSRASYSYGHASFGNETYFDMENEMRQTETRTKEQIGNLSATLSYSLRRKLFFTLGLRGEYNKQSANSAMEEVKGNNRFLLIPTLNVAYIASPKVNMSLSYRRVEGTPAAVSYDPTVIYVNKYMYKIGNPDIKGYISHTVKYAVNLPYNLSFYTTFNYIQNGIQLVFSNDEENPQLIKQSIMNVNRRYMEASLSWQHTWGGFYTLTANGEYSQSFGKMPYLGERVSLGHPSFFIDTNHRFTLGKGLSATVSGRYETKNYFFPQETDALYRVNLSLSYYVKDWILSLSGSNLIVNDTGATSKYAYLQRRFCIDSFRGVSFSIAYRFNKYTERYKRNDANDEMYYRGIRR